YTLLTGSPPYGDAGPIAAMLAHCLKPVPDPRDRRPDVPAACAAIVSRAMAKEPADRYARAADFLADLDLVLGSSRPVRRSWAWLAWLLLLVSFAIIGTALAITRAPARHASGKVAEPKTSVLGKRLPELMLNCEGEIQDVAFSPDDAHLAWLT